jgi:DNA-binding transcriptional MerR regulator
MSARRAQPARYPIRAVSRMTGIAIDTLRAWERRYQAVTPQRDGRGRLYTDDDVARLRLLNQAVASGHSVGRIAALGDADLRRLVAPAAAPSPRAAPAGARPTLDASLFTAALMKLDAVAIDQEFSRLAAVLPPVELVRDVLLPALRDVGDRWNRRRGGIAFEHLISSTMRHLLGSFLRLYARRDGATRLLFATPSGDRHEIGILGAALLAASRGFAVAYLGPDLPARDILAAVASANAHVLVLGLTLKGDGRARERELRTIVRDLPPGVELWAGGPGTERHGSVLSARGLVLEDFDAYMQQLERLGGRAG